MVITTALQESTLPSRGDLPAPLRELILPSRGGMLTTLRELILPSREELVTPLRELILPYWGDWDGTLQEFTPPLQVVITTSTTDEPLLHTSLSCFLLDCCEHAVDGSDPR